MNKRLTLISLCLSVPGIGQACAVCRPQVQAGIHNAAYVANLGLLLLPAGLLLALGVGLYWVGTLRPGTASAGSLAAV